jgi:transcriptional regulator with XRE-family HTH domain
MPSLDKAFSDFLKALRGEQSYASLASKLGIAESTLYRLTNRQQSATLRKIEKILRSQNLSLADVFGEEISKKRGACEDSMMQASGDLRAIWPRLPLFWRFQLAGWAVFVPLTFPLKLVLAGSIPGALFLSFIRDASSFALTLGMRVIYRRFLNEQNRYRAIVPLCNRCLPDGRTPANRILSFFSRHFPSGRKGFL